VPARAASPSIGAARGRTCPARDPAYRESAYGCCERSMTMRHHTRTIGTRIWIGPRLLAGLSIVIAVVAACGGKGSSY